MVIYFSKGGATRKYATALAEVKGEEIFEIKQDKPLQNNVVLAIKSVMKKEEEIANFPNIDGEDTIYLCSPVWGGGFPSAMRYFVNHANLKGKTIKLLLTCLTASDSYVPEFEKQLNDVGATLAKSAVYSAKKTPVPPVDELAKF